ncbi:MAG: hypothetical protein IJ461_02680 [Clostridia bacterium]|nr:hypothetical protein [Clostridia bacterium]
MHMPHMYIIMVFIMALLVFFMTAAPFLAIDLRFALIVTAKQHIVK